MPSPRWSTSCSRITPGTRSAGPPVSTPITRSPRYGWELVGPDGTVAVDGTDIVEIDDDGRLTRIVGFFGPLASAA